MTPEDTLLFNLWEDVLTEAKKPHPHEELARYADWALKHYLLERDREKKGYSRPDDKVKRIKNGKEEITTARSHRKQHNTEFHWINPLGSCRKMMDRPDSALLRVVSDEEIERAVLTPEKTRGEARSMGIKWAAKKARQLGKKLTLEFPVSAEWCGMDVINKPKPDAAGVIIKRLVLLDPYDRERHEASLVVPTPSSFCGG